MEFVGPNVGMRSSFLATFSCIHIHTTSHLSLWDGINVLYLFVSFNNGEDAGSGYSDPCINIAIEVVGAISVLV